MSDTIYCYPDSDVLMNKMDIRDQAKLEEAERRLTMFRMSDLLDTPVAHNPYPYIFLLPAYAHMFLYLFRLPKFYKSTYNVKNYSEYPKYFL